MTTYWTEKRTQIHCLLDTFLTIKLTMNQITFSASCVSHLPIQIDVQTNKQTSIEGSLILTDISSVEKRNIIIFFLILRDEVTAILSSIKIYIFRIKGKTTRKETLVNGSRHRVGKDKADDKAWGRHQRDES